MSRDNIVDLGTFRRKAGQETPTLEVTVTLRMSPSGASAQVAAQGEGLDDPENIRSICASLEAVSAHILRSEGLRKSVVKRRRPRK